MVTMARETLIFIGPELWLPNSVDLNPVYKGKMWKMQEKMRHTPVRNVDDLKQCLIDMWSGMQ